MKRIQRRRRERRRRRNNSIKRETNGGGRGRGRGVEAGRGKRASKINGLYNVSINKLIDNLVSSQIFMTTYVDEVHLLFSHNPGESSWCTQRVSPATVGT